MNGVVEVVKKNIKKILRKIIDYHRGWHDMLSYALLGYWITLWISIGATTCLLVYVTRRSHTCWSWDTILENYQRSWVEYCWMGQLADWSVNRIDHNKDGCCFSWSTIWIENDSRFPQECQSQKFWNQPVGPQAHFRKSTKGNSHRIGKGLTWFTNYYLEVPWSCRRWMALPI